MKSCEYDSARINLLIDGMLTPSEEAELRLHLAGCPECAEQERELREIKMFLGSPEEENVPPELHGRIMSALPEMPKKRVFDRPWVKALAAAAACAVLALVFVRLPRQMKSFSAADESPEAQESDSALIMEDPAPPAESLLPEKKSTDSMPENSAAGNGLCAAEVAVPAYAEAYVYTGDVKKLDPEADFDGSVYYVQTETGFAVIVEADSVAESEFLSRLDKMQFSKTDEEAQTLCPDFTQDESVPNTLYFLLAE